MYDLLKKYLPSLKKVLVAPLIFWGLTMVANVFNWLFNLQAGRLLTKEDFAVLTVFMSFLYLLNVPANALSTTVTRFTTYYSEMRESYKHFYFFRQYWWFSWALGFFFLILFLLFQSYIKSFFGLGSSVELFLFAILIVPLFLLSFEAGTLFGHFAFIWIGVLLVIESIVKFAILWLAPELPFSLLHLSVLAIAISTIITWVLAVLVSRSVYPLKTGGGSSLENKEEIRDTYKFLGNSIFAGLGSVLIYNIDILLVKHYFSPTDAGIYATLSLLGKILYFGAGSLIGLLIPFATRAVAKNESAKKPLYLLLAIVSLAGGAIWLAYLLLPNFVVTLLLTEKSLVAVPYLAKYSLSMWILALVSCLATYHLAKKNYLPANLLTFGALVQALFIFVFHSSIAQVVDVVLYTIIGMLGLMLVVDFLGLTKEAIFNNVLSFFRLFVRDVAFESNKTKKIKLLIFNWRDLKHVHAGGAEVYIHEIGKRLSKKGYDITLFTSNDGHCQASETNDGMKIIRRGGFITVYLWAMLYSLFKFRGKYDLILDVENGIPFFSPIYATAPVVLIVHHVHQDVFFKSLLPPFSWLANFLESYLMPRVYNHCGIVSVSRSTAEELSKEIGLKTTAIISNGVDTRFYVGAKKTIFPQISYVGRLKQYKSLEVLLAAFKKLSKEFSESQLVIAGDGDYKLTLEQKGREFGLNGQVKFLGRISEEEKVKLLGQSWVMVQPSYMEGWGITCLEANACYTPVLASRVAGLKDAVSEGESGYLFEYGNSDDLYWKLKDLLINKEKLRVLSRTSRAWSEQFSWSNQARKLDNLLRQKIRTSSLNKSPAFGLQINLSRKYILPER